MLVLHFFKAGMPYNKTNGYQHNHHWMHGVAGPMSMQECLRLAANMGGNILTMKYPGIDNLEELMEILHSFSEEGGETFQSVVDNTPDEYTGDAETLLEMVDPLPDNVNVEEIFEENLSTDEDEIVPTADSILGMDFTTFMDLNNAGVRQIADNLEIKIPSHNERLSLLAEAKVAETFNYTQYIGTSRTQIDVLKAFVLMRVGEFLNPVEA